MLNNPICDPQVVREQPNVVVGLLICIQYIYIDTYIIYTLGPDFDWKCLQMGRR